MSRQSKLGRPPTVPWAEIDADLRAGMRPRDASLKWGIQDTHLSKRRKTIGLPPLRRGRRSGEGNSVPRSPTTTRITEMLAAGRSKREVARELGLSEGTVQHAKRRWIDGVVGRAGRSAAARAGSEKRGTWATATLDGLTLTLEAWSARTGIKVETIAYRLRRGWSTVDALTMKPRGG